ncbi:MAG: hypothetical protein J7559_19120, partial [Cohnella sp.]|nr:hypothetical protein [Cohnella sp.]
SATPFDPLKPTTRAEAVVSLDNALTSRGTVFAKAGAYGPAEGSQTIDGNVEISVPGVTLKNTVINGNLILGEGIGNGDAFLKNVTVKGTTTVKGGGSNSIHLENSVLLTIIVDRANGTVRIVAEGTTTVATVIVQTPAAIEESNVTGTGFNDIKLAEQLPANSKISLKGTFANMEIASDKIQVDIPSGSVQKIEATEGATDSQIRLGADATIVNLVLHSAMKMLGEGKIVNATVSEKAKAGTTFEKEPEKVVNAETSGGGAPIFGGGGAIGGGTPPVTPTDDINAVKTAIELLPFTYVTSVETNLPAPSDVRGTTIVWTITNAYGASLAGVSVSGGKLVVDNRHNSVYETGVKLVATITKSGGASATAVKTLDIDVGKAPAYFDQSNASFTANENRLYFSVVGQLSGPLNMSKIKYATGDAGNNATLTGSYSEVGLKQVYSPGEYYILPSGERTFIYITLTDADAAAIKALAGYGNDSSDAGQDRILVSSGWFSNSGSATKKLSINNAIHVLNVSDSGIRTAHYFDSNDTQFAFEDVSISFGEMKRILVDSRTTKIVFYAGAYAETPVNGKMQIVDIRGMTNFGTIKLDSYHWSTVDSTNFGQGPGTPANAPLSDESIIAFNKLIVESYPIPATMKSADWQF